MFSIVGRLDNLLKPRNFFDYGAFIPGLESNEFELNYLPSKKLLI